ncbi:hypothetical protein EUGRSUZ_K03396 [Eucalyptus grandis]|uniref:Uncharacterized protein n=2 Tax=Eucalyptus grandis TaxID=71139 RepID=A0A059A9C5_EUCGR|nr:hypothetical protein EUGRSUZ_K03396 [Eucalyptus grandis]
MLRMQRCKCLKGSCKKKLSNESQLEQRKQRIGAKKEQCKATSFASAGLFLVHICLSSIFLLCVCAELSFKEWLV